MKSDYPSFKLILVGLKQFENDHIEKSVLNKIKTKSKLWLENWFTANQNLAPTKMHIVETE